MFCHNLDTESPQEALYNMEYELTALGGILDVIEYAAMNPAVDPNDSIRYATRGASLLLSRQSYRMEKHGYTLMAMLD